MAIEIYIFLNSYQTHPSQFPLANSNTRLLSYQHLSYAYLCAKFVFSTLTISLNTTGWTTQLRLVSLAVRLVVFDESLLLVQLEYLQIGCCFNIGFAIQSLPYQNTHLLSLVLHPR